MSYFNNCKTAEELKKEYRKQAARLHPDNNPGKDTTAAFQDMQAEFEKAWDRVKNIHVNAAGETYEKETTETAAEFMEIINRLLKMPGVNVEVCGSWIWATGNTKAYKSALKEIGFKWASRKSAWYFHFGPYRKRSKSELSLDEIRRRFGSVNFGTGDDDYTPAPTF